MSDATKGRSRYLKATVAGRTVSVHRIVAEQKVGRPLTRAEVVHHLDHDPYNNAPENLEVLTHAEHSALHNNKHPRTKACVVCGNVFTPKPTKRARQRTCSHACWCALASENAKTREARRAARREC